MKEHTEKAFPLIVVTQAHSILGISKKRKHLLPRFSPKRNNIHLCDSVIIHQLRGIVNAPKIR